MKKKRTKLLVFFALAGILVLFYMIGESYCEGLSGGSSLEEKNEVMCKYKYDMIVDSPNSSFWQAVYDCAQEWAQKNDAILELRGSGRESDYSKLDYMNMSIASNSDGIILQYSGEQGLEAKINEAVQKGIPVVTVMGDAVHSKRQSFVGVSDYQLGSAYGEKVAEYVTEDTESILILLKKNIDDMNQSQIYTQISNAAQAKAGPSQNIQITGKNLRLTGTFETEEAVTDIFQQRDKVPDIILCALYASTIGVIGFKSKTGCSASGTHSLGYMTGVRNCQAITTIPNINSISLKYTVSADIINVIPSASMYSVSITTGNTVNANRLLCAFVKTNTINTAKKLNAIVIKAVET